MPREAFDLPIKKFLQLRLAAFMRSVRACGLPVDEEEAQNNFPLWEREYHQHRSKIAA